LFIENGSIAIQKNKFLKPERPRDNPKKPRDNPKNKQNPKT
jgi:hypothetical protein